MLEPEILLTLKFNQQLFVDPKRIALLKAIQMTGSLSQAAKLIGSSYKSAWDSINKINKLSQSSFVISSTGGKGGGGAKLSLQAERFIQLYDLLTQMQNRAFSLLKDDDIALKDILSATAKLSLHSSARNQLYGTIQTITENDFACFATVLLNDNQTQITVYITHTSLERLNLVVGKMVLLLIKAPQIEFEQKTEHNYYHVDILAINSDQYWGELTLALTPETKLYMTSPIRQLNKLDLQQGKSVNIYINPENIILMTLN